MPEYDTPADLEQPFGLGGGDGVGRKFELGGSAPHEGRVAHGLGGRKQQHEPRRLRQPLHPPEKALLNPARQRELVRYAEATRQLRRAQPARQFQQGQRVAVRLGQDSLSNLPIEWPSHHRVQQRPGVLVTQARHLQLWKGPELFARLAGGEDEPGGLGQQPPRREGQHLGGRPVQPLGIIDHAQQRPFLRDLRQQRQDRQCDQEPVWRIALTQPERDCQRVLLRSRKPLEAVQQRCAQLVQAGERQLHLRCHPCGPRHPHIRCRRHHVLKQRRLAHARLAADHQRPPAPRSQIAEEIIKRPAFSPPVQ
jgi:hypothetical protein